MEETIIPTLMSVTMEIQLMVTVVINSAMLRQIFNVKMELLHPQTFAKDFVEMAQL